MPIDPGFGERLARRVTELFAEAELTVLRRMADALAQGIDAPDWAVSKAWKLAVLRRQWETDLAGLDKAAADRVLSVIAQAWQTGQATAITDIQDAGVEIVMPPSRVRAVEAIAANTLGVVSATRGPVLRTLGDVFQRVVAEASTQVLTGTSTRRQAAQAAMEALTGRGITGFTDRSGRNWSLPSYVEMAVRTGAGKAAVDGHIDQLSSAGLDLVLVSDAPRECPACRPWEGKVLSITGGVAGVVTVASATTGRPVRVRVAGSVAQARAAGLGHPNCRHSLNAYLPGATTKPAVTADRAGGYDAQQRQREIERHIRSWKLREATAIDPAARENATRKVRSWQAELRAHLAANADLKRQSGREQIGRAV